MTKEEILTAIREVAEKLGHPPTFSQLEDMTPMRRRHIRKHFGNFLWALKECGLTGRFNIRKIPEDMLFLEWARVVRKLGSPSHCKIDQAGAQVPPSVHYQEKHLFRYPAAVEPPRQAAFLQRPQNSCQNIFVCGVSAWASCLPVVKTSADSRFSAASRLPSVSLLSSWFSPRNVILQMKKATRLGGSDWSKPLIFRTRFHKQFEPAGALACDGWCGTASCVTG